MKRNYRKIIICSIIVFILLIFAVCIVIPGCKFLKLNVKSIQVHYNVDENDRCSFEYGGSIYYDVARISYHDIPYAGLEKTCLGRARGTFIVLYELAIDKEHTIIVGENPLDCCVYSNTYDVIPSDGKVTGVHLHLSAKEKNNNIGHYSVVKETYVDDEEEIRLFQKLWDERYKNGQSASFHYEHGNEPLDLLLMFCFDGCPLPQSGEQYHLSYRSGKWYFVDLWRGLNDGYESYLIDDPELIAYLNEYIKY